jgi:sRNA-binding regulator protein Hfq
VEATNRKLIRPPVASKESHADKKPVAAPKKSGPSESTNAENFYYSKQIQQKTPMVVVLRDNEELHGVFEWYDKACIKMNLDSGSPAMVYKNNIKYIYKED